MSHRDLACWPRVLRMQNLPGQPLAMIAVLRHIRGPSSTKESAHADDHDCRRDRDLIKGLGSKGRDNDNVP